ncbi:30S ribosomal protein S10 [Candidatus Marsarchaeota G1 archaeon BE_D]|uniref:Small ribosomal subunit protein uS10 n=1 Tax=Candidatus Marsarchaeota G1 archaeon BE_D TaxID=1978156 RepID=A0A2R6AIW6_9ARCH|nr:MAG: 30S ribosomal protein S10 [Candidatus Marsarchaeota G1 archaeon BE_D]
MPQKARIRLWSTDIQKLNMVCSQIVELGKKSGVKVSGPIPLPTKKLKVVTRRSPCGEGTDTYDKWVMKIHKRIIDLPAEERTMRQLMRISVPEGVKIELELV